MSSGGSDDLSAGVSSLQPATTPDNADAVTRTAIAALARPRLPQRTPTGYVRARRATDRTARSDLTGRSSSLPIMYEWSDEHLMIRDAMRDFVAKEIKPNLE